MVWMLESMDFAQTVQIFDKNLLQAPLTHLQEQFRVFLDRLEEATSHNSIEDLMKTDSKDIIKKFPIFCSRERRRCLD